MILRHPEHKSFDVSTMLKTLKNTKFHNNCLLDTVLWIPDHKAYSDRFVLTEFPFYRCFSRSGGGIDSNAWILIPLYIRQHSTTPTNSNPTVHMKNGHSTNFAQTLEIFHMDIYRQLSFMFGDLANCFSMIFRNKSKRNMVQIPKYPASMCNPYV